MWNGTAWGDFFSTVTSVQNLNLLGVGTTADAANPLSAKLNNALFAAKTVGEGGDGNLRYKLNKESASKTLSLLFQDNWSGRAEIGLIGDDDFHFKVSPDGAGFLEALTIDRTTGKLSFGQGFLNSDVSRAQLAAAPSDALAFNGLQINGGMELSQEVGASAVVLTASTSIQTRHLVDQWMAVYRGTFAATAQQVADAPPGYANSLKLTVTTSEPSLGSNDELTLVQPIEGTRVRRLALGTSAAGALAIGFWVKAHRTGMYSGAVKNTNVGGGSPRSYPFAFTVASADTWEFKAATIRQLDIEGTWGSGTAAGLYLALTVAAGAARSGIQDTWAANDYSGASGTTNGLAAIGDSFQLTGVVVLPGIELPTAERAAYIMRPATDELRLCQRYYQTVGFRGGIAVDSTRIYGPFNFLVAMRAAPAIALVSFAGTVGAWSKCTDNSDTAAATYNSADEVGFLQVLSSGLSPNVGYFGKTRSDARMW